ncbi:MAG: MATE family efflux transporter [Dorea sp. 42_8]|nr:MAG: MATE family efflux transporter [Dorea sp. 42_8]
MERDLTTGSVFKTVIYFSLPYLLSYFLQTLYGMADLFIVGQFGGVSSTTAVSIGSQIMHMLTVMIVGLAMGATVMIGRCIGAKDYKKASETIGNTATMFMGIAIILMIILLAAVRPIVSVMSTPAEAVEGTIRYLTICFIGIPFITAYNIISAIFRGIGDSKSPMYFIAVACAANIGLDYLFIGVMGLDAVGAALGTTIAQAVSVIVSLTVIILKVGVPVALQDGFIQISFIAITIFANQRGLNDAAAVGIVEKIIGILFLVPSSMLSTISALASQNIGAGKHDRARLTLRYVLYMTVGYGLAAATIVQFLSVPFVGLFTNDGAVQILGGQYLRSYAWDCVFAGVHFCLSGYFYAYGLSIVSFIHNSISIVCARIPLSYYAATHFPDTLFPMGCASPAGSMVSIVICVGVFVWMNKHTEKYMERT